MSKVATEPVSAQDPAGSAMPDQGSLMVRHSDALPVGAWLADIRGLHVSALVGENVETFEDGLVEGCWDGPFARHAFERADNMFGSGLKRLDGSVVLVTPSHTLEALYVHEAGGRIVASNSLAFLLEHEGLEPPPGGAICRRLATLVLGVAEQERLLFEHAGGRVLRIAHAAIAWRGGRLSVTPRTFDRHYTGFADYKSYLLETLRAVFENGASRQRRALLRPIASVSSGYDSNAGAALAAALGCRQALTLKSARGGHADSGHSVGEALGLEVLEFEPPSESAKTAAHDEAEFVATGMGGEDIPLAAFEPALRARILLTGFHGDKVWYPEARPNAVLARGDLSGSSLAEFRLRLGFVHVPLPFIGALRHDEVRQVGLSAEMAPWRLGTSYDPADSAAHPGGSGRAARPFRANQESGQHVGLPEGVDLLAADAAGAAGLRPLERRGKHALGAKQLVGALPLLVWPSPGCQGAEGLAIPALDGADRARR
jgi:hypothetical protein